MTSKRITGLDVSRYISSFHTASRHRGMEFEVGDDFDEYINITKIIVGKAPTYPNFRPDCSWLESGRAFWIVGRDRSGQVAHVQALRMDDLRSTNLAEHLESLKGCYAHPKSMTSSDSSCACHAPAARQIAGIVVYHGDLWLRDDFRGQGFPSALAGIAFGLAWAKWSPDFIYALVPGWIIEKGVAEQYGYLNREPRGSVLRLSNLGIEDDDWLIWLTKNELSGLIRRTLNADEYI
ncbi:hypothetical protein DPM35_31925 [Mesorhizobium atlanticum]|uniref:GNAT family N-acetyltransferase n=1 Tax=Mesorhizobium atlanticum TaxID=2233532 RepID=A0A330GFY6_9HYPH|nr:hypothetical protein DPM35_31925 [Mesorhizobium atlanticum]